MSAPLAPLASLNPGKGAGGGRRCTICQLPLQIRTAVEERLNRGDAATQIHSWLVKTFPKEAANVRYDTIPRHRRTHMAGVSRAAAKLSDAERMLRQRQKLARDVLADKAVDPAVYFGPAALAQDIQKTSARLDLAADDAFLSREHSSLAALSNSLLRAVEIRGKLGGSIADRTEVSLTVSLNDLHARLDNVLAAPAIDRQGSARALLGLRHRPIPRKTSALMWARLPANLHERSTLSLLAASIFVLTRHRCALSEKPPDGPTEPIAWICLTDVDRRCPRGG